MKIYVLGSNAFMRDMVAAKDRLLALGLMAGFILII